MNYILYIYMILDVSTLIVDDLFLIVNQGSPTFWALDPKSLYTSFAGVSCWLYRAQFQIVLRSGLREGIKRTYRCIFGAIQGMILVKSKPLLVVHF